MAGVKEKNESFLSAESGNNRWCFPSVAPWGSMDGAQNDACEKTVAVTNGPPFVTAVRAVANAKGVDTTDLPSLYSAVSSAVQNALFRGRPPDDITFSYEGYTVTIRESVEITVREQTNSEP